MEVAVQMSPVGKKVYDFLRPGMDLLLYGKLHDAIIKQLEDDDIRYRDLNEAVELLTELNAEIFRDYPGLVTPFRAKGGYLWFLAKHTDGFKYWHTVAEHDVHLVEEA